MLDGRSLAGSGTFLKKLQLHIQLKSNFAHKVELDLYILLLFYVQAWKGLIVFARRVANKDHWTALFLVIFC